MLRVLMLEAAAFWPVWIWWGQRIAADPDAGWGLAALATAIWFRWKGAEPPLSVPSVPAAAIFLYAALSPLLPPIFRAALAVLAIALTLGCTAGMLGLCAIALPVTASLEFFAGLPMRLAASRMASWLLQSAGMAVAADGTGLRWAGGVVEVDVPCSGIRMLWAGLYLGLAAACAYRAGWLRTVAVAAAAVAAVVLGNAARTAALFYLEAGLLPGAAPLENILHAGAGLAVFAGIAAVAVQCARW